MTNSAVLSLVILIGAAASAQQSSTPSFGVPPPREERPTSQPSTRRVAYQVGRDVVAESRKSGDAVVEVIRESSPPFMRPSGNALEEIEALTRLADAVTVVRIKAKRAALTARKDWIASSADAVVHEILKNSSTQPLTVGQTLSIAERGGEMNIDGRRIVASDVWARPTTVGGEYLVFWAIRPDGAWTTFGEVYTFERQATRWARLLVDRHDDGLDVMDRERVLSEIQIRVHLPRPEGGRK